MMYTSTSSRADRYACVCLRARVAVIQMDGLIGKWPPNQVHLFAGTWWYHLGCCLKKHWLLFVRDKSYTAQHLGTAVFMALVMGSIFFGLPLLATNDKFGVLFFALLYLGLGGLRELPPAIASRNVFYKQHAQVCDVADYSCSQTTLRIGAYALVCMPSLLCSSHFASLLVFS